MDFYNKLSLLGEGGSTGKRFIEERIKLSFQMQPPSGRRLAISNIFFATLIVGSITSRCSGNEPEIFSGRKAGPEGAAEIEPTLNALSQLSSEIAIIFI